MLFSRILIVFSFCDLLHYQVSDGVRHGVLGLNDFSVSRYQISDQQVWYMGVATDILNLKYT